MAKKKFRCNVCGYIHEGSAAPEKCPVCGVPASDFADVTEPKKGLFSDKNGNAYILMYATVMVVVVAALLAVAAMALKERQDANVMNEKKQAILESLGAEDQNYDDFVTAYAVDAEGAKVDSITGDEALQMLFDLKGTFEKGLYPVFQAHDGRVVLPVYGSGLWGPIWGYVALDKDMDTISGVVFSHAGETPGLGSEIATPKHWAKYVGKTIFQDGQFVSVKLRKGGAKDPAHEVDAISGGTKTSDGVTNMLSTSIGHYLPFLEFKKRMHALQMHPGPAVPEESGEGTEENVESENVENNE